MFLCEREAMGVLYALLSALDHLHRVVGVLHRDVKPANVLLQTSGHSGDPPLTKQRGAFRVKLADYGVAADNIEGFTVVGTMRYAAPEVCGPRNPHPRAIARSLQPPQGTYGPPADIFSLGVTMQFVLSGGCCTSLGKTWVVSESDMKAVPGSGVWIIPRFRLCSSVEMSRYPSATKSKKTAHSWRNRADGWAVYKPAKCHCESLHPEVVFMINAMVDPDPAQRPTIPELMRSFPVLFHGEVTPATTTGLYPHMFGRKPTADESCYIPLWSRSLHHTIPSATDALPSQLSDRCVLWRPPDLSFISTLCRDDLRREIDCAMRAGRFVDTSPALPNEGRSLASTVCTVSSICPSDMNSVSADKSLSDDAPPAANLESTWNELVKSFRSSG
jgi:serine/threonine protein kinase